MSRISIVGVDGSGKTVLMAVFGGLLMMSAAAANGGGIGIAAGSVCCAGDATLGCLDFLTFGWLGNHVFYNDDMWDMKPWFFERKAKVK